MKLNGLQKIMGTARRKSTTRSRTRNKMNHGTQDQLVKTDQQSDRESDHSSHQDLSLGRGRSPSRRACRSQSASSSAKVACEAPGRAIVTK